MTPTAERQIRAALDARGVPGPPPGPGLWVVEDRYGFGVVDTDGQYCISIGGDDAEWNGLAVARITRHVALFPEVLP